MTLAIIVITIGLIGAVAMLSRMFGRKDAELDQARANVKAQKRKDAVPDATSKSVADKLRKHKF